MGRAPCCDKNGLKKGPWTPEEDLKLITYIQTHGPGNWRSLPKNAGLQRCGKSCRLRWTNYLRPDIKRGRFSFEEEETIIQLHSILGNKWSAIAARLPGRTDNEIKNYWNTHIRKRLLRNGIDPVTHAPRLDLLDLSSVLGSTLCSQSLINVSNLLGAQALLNPELLRLASTLFSLKQDNPEVMLQYLQQNQLLPDNSQNLNPAYTLLQQQTHQTSQFQADPIHQEASHCTTTSADATCSSFLNQTTPNLVCSGIFSQPNYVESGSNPTLLSSLLSENSSLGFDSVISTPLSNSCSSTPLNSSSTFVNSTSPEDERESYSSLLKFEIPESFDISDFM